jgi:hypothetical protein
MKGAAQNHLLFRFEKEDHLQTFLLELAVNFGQGVNAQVAEGTTRMPEERNQ